MIHPFMPFLTEELWQRLPRRTHDTTPSIVKASYPTYQPELDDPASEVAYELILGVSKGIRSLMAEYTIKDAGVIHIQLFNATAHATCVADLASIRSLSGKAVSSIALLAADAPKPTGCVPFAVSSAATVFLVVKGRVDIEAEIGKARRKLERATETVKRQRAILEDGSYREKVREELQEVERRKLRDAEAEVREMEACWRQFERLKVE